MVRLGNKIADRQWQDLLGVLRTQGKDKLDLDYLDTWAGHLDLEIFNPKGIAEPSPGFGEPWVENRRRD